MSIIRKIFSTLRPSTRSLSSELTFIILILAVPIFVLSLWFLMLHSSNNVRMEATEHANSVLNTTMQRVRRYMNAVETATNIYSWEIMENMQPDSLLAISHRVVRLNPHIDGCSISTEPYVFPQIGRYFSAYSIREGDSITTVIEEKYEYFDKVWYKKPVNIGKACWVDFYDETDSLEVTLEGMVASYSKPLYNEDKELVAIISTDLSLKHLSKIITAEKPYPNSYFMMLGEEGRYFIHPDSTLLFRQTIFSNANPNDNADIIALGHEMTSNGEGSMSVVIDGKLSQVCYQPVPGTEWSLAIVCPESDILSNYYKLTYIIVAIIIVGLIIIILLCRRAVTHAVKPINQLLRKTQSIASGNYEVHIPKSKREDAIGRLQNSFARMLQSLNFQMGSIRYTTEHTEHRNKELLKATQLAQEAARQKTIFIRNITHQIRTPLNIIMGFSEVLRDFYGQLPEEEKKSISNTMKHNAMILTRMIHMLIDSSDSNVMEEQKNYELETVKCNDVTREAIDYVLNDNPDKYINFKTDVSDDFSIRTCRIYLVRSLSELLYNAAKYSDGQHISMSIVKGENTIRFITEDTGDGIAEADCDRIFESFTKINDLSEGLGLGLPLTKHHIRNLGGDITLDADYHDGCRFIIELPISQEDQEKKD